MTLAHFLVISGESNEENKVLSSFPEKHCEILGNINGIERIDLYKPASFDDPLPGDDHGPLLTIQSFYRDRQSLETGLNSSEFRSLINKLEEDALRDMSHDVLEVKFFPVENDEHIREWKAPVSYVVRYHHPCDDLDTFVDFYLENHPQIERKFPGIQNIICYVPTEWTDSTNIRRCDYMLGNEVIFESTDALGMALTSPIMDEMAADFENFPSFGRNTHFAMERIQLF